MDINDESELRERARRNLEAKRNFVGVVGAWLFVAVLCTVVWAFTGRGYFWPMWPMLGVGIGVVFAGIALLGPRRYDVTESRIQAEMRRLKGE